jgi:hypothetical protein
VEGRHAARFLCRHGRVCARLPGVASLRHLLAVLGGSAEVTPRSEVRGEGAIRGEQTLGVSRAFASPHAGLALAGRVVSMLGAVVQIPVLSMFHTGPDRAQGRTIAWQLIRDDHPRPIGQPREQLPAELLRRLLVPRALYQAIEEMTVLVDGAP